MANIALLIAGGYGNRMHQDIPKQFITVNERPVIVYTLEAFEKHPEIDVIAVVCIEGWEQVLWAYAKQFNITKLQYVVPGGKNGQSSIRKYASCELGADHRGHRPAGGKFIIFIHHIRGNEYMYIIKEGIVH